jgi:hypothetical protein
MQMDNHKVLESEVTFDDGLQSMPALKEGSAEVRVVHGGLRCVQMIGSAAEEIVNYHP